jgi:very-short-patch-repair endonuclease
MSTMIDAGVRRSAIRRSIDDQQVDRIARSWVALPQADPTLISAAQVGVAVTCVSQAERLGLWSFGTDETHVAAPPHGQLRRPTMAHVHWGNPIVARHPDALEDSIVNALAYVAACQPFEKALVVWESAARKELVVRETLAKLPFGPQGRRILAEMSWFSDSGLESGVIPRLRWLRVPMRPQISIAGHRVDLLIGDRLVLQIDGGHHVDAQRTEDNRHDAMLMLMGYHVIRVSYHQVVNRWHEVQDMIATAIAQGLHRIR